MQIQEVLYSQGFGTRRVCAGLVQQGWVSIQAEGEPHLAPCLDASQEVQEQGLLFSVQGILWPYQEKAYLVLHKPMGYECSQKPSAHPSIYTLLPSPLRQRPSKSTTAGVQAIGRLDQDTTGLLLLSDDGRFMHRLASPKKRMPKIYQVTTVHPVTDQQVQRLLDGVVLDDDPKPVRAAACMATGECRIDLTLTEGKYHQVKRMLAAVGNRVQALHRSRIGGLELPGDLLPGQWRWLDSAQLQLLGEAPASYSGATHL